MNTRSLRFRITAWYAGLLAGTLMVFGASVYLGLERYLDWTLQRTLVSECRTIATELLSQLPAKDTAWLAREINEAYAPEVNGLFIRVVDEGGGIVYLSGAPKDGMFEPLRLPFPSEKEKDGPRKLQFGAGNRLLINSMTLTTPDGNRLRSATRLLAATIDSAPTCARRTTSRRPAASWPTCSPRTC